MSTCPTCGPAVALVDSRGASCGGELLSPAQIEALVERVGVKRATLVDVVSAGKPSAPCPACQSPMREASIAGAGFLGCAKCGAAFVSRAAALRLASPDVNPPTAPAVGAAGSARKPAHDDDKLHLPSRARIAVAPLAALAVASALTALLVKSPLLSPSLAWLVAAVLAPAPSALVVHVVAPTRKGLASVAASIGIGALVFFAGVAAVPPLAFFAAASVGALLGVMLASSPGRIRLGRAVTTTAVLVVALVATGIAHGRYATALADGCPAGASKRSLSDVSCFLPDGTRHGPGERLGSNDKPLEVGTWNRGRRDGAFKLNYPSGRKRGEGLFAADLEEGPWLFFREDGTLEESGVFRHGRREGPWKQDDDAGKPRGGRRLVNGVRKELMQ